MKTVGNAGYEKDAFVGQDRGKPSFTTYVISCFEGEGSVNQCEVGKVLHR